MRGAALALACLALLVLEVTGDGGTVRLCGRDFIRAVVFTCGGSRWRRHLPERHRLGQSENPQWDEGDADFSPHAERIRGEEPQDVRPEQNSQNPGEIWVRSKREAARALATSCCSEGCSRREISSLC